jgi:ADP-ribosylglycohydrolase
MIKYIKEIFKKEEIKIQPRESEDHSLEKFVDAQERMYEIALAEVKSGKKQSHWIWYIFPQLEGLGHSAYAQRYGISGKEETQAFLSHHILGKRLREITNILLSMNNKSAVEIFGDLDAMKVRSSMTLFDIISPNDIFAQVLDKYYNGERCPLTIKKIFPISMRGSILGAITGDIIGARFEFSNCKYTDFELFDKGCDFTDDTVMTIAVADWLLSGVSLANIICDWANEYPNRGYGGMFYEWLFHSKDKKPYKSFGNGSGMRVSPCGYYANSLNEALELAKLSAEVTHNHPEGIKGAQAIAAAIFLARQSKSKEEIRYYIEQTFGYNLHRTCEEIRPTYRFDATCQGSCPEAIIAFLDSTDYESAIRLAISLGGDSDTIACMTGGIAAAYYGMPDWIEVRVKELYLPSEMVDIINRFDVACAKRAMLRLTPDKITELAKGEIFVFGSNLAGKHAGGAARTAVDCFGAVWGQGVGLQGQSYAIPTMQGNVDTIRRYVDEFVLFATQHPELRFYVTPIGCGIAGFTPADIAPLFKNAAFVENIFLPRSFWKILGSH